MSTVFDSSPSIMSASGSKTTTSGFSAASVAATRPRASGSARQTSPSSSGVIANSLRCFSTVARSASERSRSIPVRSAFHLEIPFSGEIKSQVAGSPCVRSPHHSRPRICAMASCRDSRLFPSPPMPTNEVNSPRSMSPSPSRQASVGSCQARNCAGGQIVKGWNGLLSDSFADSPEERSAAISSNVGSGSNSAFAWSSRSVGSVFIG